MQNLKSIAAPNLPVAPELYLRRYQDQLNNVLRLYFNQLSGLVNTLSNQTNWMSGWDTTKQTISSTTTAYIIKVNSIDPASLGFVLNADYSVATPVDGLYIMQFSLQLTNTDSSAHAASAWVRVNSEDVAFSRSQISVPSKHGGTNGGAILTVIYTLPLNKGDTVQLMWAAKDTKISLETLPASVSPPMPASPSVIASIFQVA